MKSYIIEWQESKGLFGAKIERRKYMTKFAGMKTLDEVCGEMQDKGMIIDTKEFDRGGDWYYFKGAWYDFPATIAYNTTNGQFMVYNGFTSKLLATHLSEELDSEEWYKELLSTFYKVA